MVGHGGQSGLQQVFGSLHDGDASVLNIDLEANGQLIAQVQKEIQRFKDDKSIEQMVEAENFHNGSWTRFNMLVVSFLKFCRDVNPWSVSESADLIFELYQGLGNCLLNDTYPVQELVQLYCTMTEYVVKMSRRLDSHYCHLGTRKHQFLTITTAVISKVFNSVKPHHDEAFVSFEDLSQKQQILLYLANKLNNCYILMGSSSSCANIFKNVKPKSALSQFSEFPLRERVEYRYLLGRYYLLNHRVSNAFHQLNSAFSLLATQRTMSDPLRRNMRRVLKFLVPASMMFGKLPSTQLVAEIDPALAHMYVGLIHAIKSGHFDSFYQWLYEHELQLRSDCLLLLLLEKIPVLLYRNLVRRIVRELCIPQNSNKLPYGVVQNILEVSLRRRLGEPQLPLIYTAVHDPANVENVLETLVNLTLFRANCFPLSNQCVFSKTTNISSIFPPVNEKLTALFPLNGEDSWLDT
ncbi:LAMI_0H08196g1_1 [Lachancea mirantina]|uniref:LAMI_0H08196g1_1 n=1 Tax=Lachancea mirantina TaxID=1230905 RepID=A0A1G4KG29_9SACH|nr:LAMI_0H08196g1_1 [Lachancea mirantina]